MQTTLRTTLLLLAGFASSAALAQKIGDPAPDIEFKEGDRGSGESRFNVGEYRGRIILMFFYRSTDPVSLDAMSIISGVINDYAGRGVVVHAITPEKQEQAEGPMKAKGFEPPHRFYGQAFQEIYEITSYPYIILVDPQGIIAWKGHPFHDLEGVLKEQIRRTPPIGAREEALQRMMKRAEEFHSQGECGKAITVVLTVMRVTEKGGNMHEQANSLREKLLESAKKWLEEAREAKRAGDNKKACRIVAEVSVRFETDKTEGAEKELAAEAATEVGRLRSEMATKEMMDNELNNSRGELKNAEALDMEEVQDYPEAIRIYRKVVEDYKDTPAAKAAKEAIDRLTGDPKIKSFIDDRRKDEQADRWYDIADRYLRAKMEEQAKETLEKIVRERPRSPAATKAKEALKKLKDEKKG
jgi:tetratricopeptide (TPR) repeat protein